MRLLAALGLLLLLSGCQGNLLRLRELNPPANDFPGALAAEYLAFADAEAELGHEDQASYFAQKGINALDEQEVMPEAVDKGLPKPTQDKLSSARESLLTILTPDMKHVAFQKLARAQLLFDCWQLQEKQPDRNAMLCSDEFRSTLGELQDVAESFVLEDESQAQIEFSEDTSTLDEEATRTIDTVAARAKATAKYALTLEASGKTTHERSLAAARLEAVRKAFTERGLSAKRIKIVKQSDSKAVHLSRDESVQKRDSVKVTIKTFGQGKKK